MSIRLTNAWTLALLAIAVPFLMLWGLGSLIEANSDRLGWDALFFGIWLALWVACAFVGLTVLAVAKARPQSAWLGAAQRSLLFLLGIGSVIPTLSFFVFLLVGAVLGAQGLKESVGLQLFFAPVTLLGATGAWVLHRLWRDCHGDVW